MSTYTYKEILSKAKECKTGVETKQELTISTKWTYYICKSILNPKKDIKKLQFDKAPKPLGTYISRQIKKASYLKLAKATVEFVEKHKRLPNCVKFGEYKIRPSIYVYMFSRILVYYYKHNELPLQVNVNNKAYEKPVETGNAVYDYFTKKTGKKFKYLDDFCDWIKNKVTYQFYFDDQKTNKQVIDSKAGNCTDLLQLTCNMAEAMGYEWKVIHTKCKQSGTGHVYGMFRKKGTTEWFIRDVACIADENRYCVWCQVPTGGTKLAENPSWFLENLHR